MKLPRRRREKTLTRLCTSILMLPRLTKGVRRLAVPRPPCHSHQPPALPPPFLPVPLLSLPKWHCCPHWPRPQKRASLRPPDQYVHATGNPSPACPQTLSALGDTDGALEDLETAEKLQPPGATDRPEKAYIAQSKGMLHHKAGDHISCEQQFRVRKGCEGGAYIHTYRQT